QPQLPSLRGRAGPRPPPHNRPKVERKPPPPPGGGRGGEPRRWRRRSATLFLRPRASASATCRLENIKYEKRARIEGRRSRIEDRVIRSTLDPRSSIFGPRTIGALTLFQTV